MRSNLYPIARPKEITEADAILSPAETAELLNVSRRTLEGWRLKGKGPAYIQLGLRSIGYRHGDLKEFIESHRRPTREQE